MRKEKKHVYTERKREGRSLMKKKSATFRIPVLKRFKKKKKRGLPKVKLRRRDDCSSSPFANQGTCCGTIRSRGQIRRPGSRAKGIVAMKKKEDAIGREGSGAGLVKTSAIRFHHSYRVFTIVEGGPKNKGIPKESPVDPGGIGGRNKEKSWGKETICFCAFMGGACVKG